MFMPQPIAIKIPILFRDSEFVPILIKCFSTFRKKSSYIQKTFAFHVQGDFYIVHVHIVDFLFFFFRKILTSFTYVFFCFFW